MTTSQPIRVRPRVALYARVSTTQHGQDIGLQLDELREAARRRSWKVAHQATDEGHSGASRVRPGLDEVLRLVLAGKVDVVAVWKLDRLSRNVRHALELLDTLQRHGVELVALHDPVDTTTPMGRCAVTMLAAFAQLEREQIVERVVAGVRRAQANGKHCGRPRVELDLRPALAMLDKGYSQRETARALGVSPTTLSRRLREYRTQQAPTDP